MGIVINLLASTLRNFSGIALNLATSSGRVVRGREVSVRSTGRRVKVVRTPSRARDARRDIKQKR